MVTEGRETEVKLRVVGDLLDLRQRVAALTNYATRTEEENYIFDTAEGKLKKRKQVLRVRLVKNADAAYLDPELELTFKDKGSLNNGISSRPEFNVRADNDDYGNLVNVLKGLGYVPSFVYEKRRESWALFDYKAKVELDELPHIGHFMEIEAPDEETIERVIDRLMIAHFERVGTNYIRLLREEMKRRGIKGIEARFKD